MKNQYEPSRTEMKAREERRRAQAFKAAYEMQDRESATTEAEAQRN